MNNFNFHADTEIVFGKGEIYKLPSLLKKYGGKNVLLCFGGGSIKKNGIYNNIYELLNKYDFQIFELSGIEPNPRIETVRKGSEICKNNKIDVVLAVGGGSVIDCAKVIAAANYYDGDPWDLVLDGSKIDNVLPIVTILTLAATGSEMNRNAVISNMSTNEKIGTYGINLIPKASILDPEYLYSLPAIQTAAGTADIMSHIFENYFSTTTDAFIQDKFAEGILQACIKYCPIALATPHNYSARANLMWASSMALNGLTGCGKGHAWSCHAIEHQLSAYYDITHGIGLAIITPKWMRYILNEKTVEKFAEFGRNVWHLEDEGDNFSLARKAIDCTEEFFKNCGIPMTLTELNIDEKYFEEMAIKATKGGSLNNAYVPLDKKDIIRILKACL